jgi:hypothetical protein
MAACENTDHGFKTAFGPTAAKCSVAHYLLKQSNEGVATFVYINLTRRTATVILTNSANGGQIVLPILELLGQDHAFVSCVRREAY